MSKKSLHEALKRHKQIIEYTFFNTESDDPFDPQNKINGNDLLLDTELEEQEEEVTDVAPAGDEISVEEPATDELSIEEPATEEPSMELPTEEPSMDMGTPSADGEVEVDVTDIVKTTEETKNSVSGLDTKIGSLMSTFSDLETKLASMDTIISKIDQLEKEIEKRNPTPIEKLEMRSMSSFPYNIKLTDYWNDKEGYDVSEPEEKEYILTQEDVDADYSESEIKNTFKPTPNQ
jgi:hypothetical protein